MADHRLFVAVWPTDDTIGAIESLPRKDRPGVRFVSPPNWHVTLRYLGDVAVEEVGAALDGCDLQPAVARLGPIVELLGDHSVVVPVTGVEQLADQVTRATRHLGQPPRRRFVGHLTLARLSRSRSIRRSYPPPVVGMPFDVSFEVGSIALVDSTLRPDGARYTTIATWPCAGNGGDNEF